MDCQTDSPYRPVDWRWQLASGIRAGALDVRRRRLDPWTRRAIRLQDALARAEGGGAARGDAAALGAFQFHQASDPRPRWELEARILAGQSNAEIAARLGIADDVVESHENLFFNVRDRLGASDFVAATLIGVTHDGIAAGDIGRLLKIYAYRGGPVVLDAFIQVLDDKGPGGSLASSAVTIDEPLARSIRMAILARSMPVTGQTAPGLIRLYARFQEVERQAADDVALTGPIRAMFGAWPVSLAADREQSPWGATAIDTGPTSPDVSDRCGLRDRYAAAEEVSGAYRLHDETWMRRTA